MFGTFDEKLKKNRINVFTRVLLYIGLKFFLSFVLIKILFEIFPIFFGNENERGGKEKTEALGGIRFEFDWGDNLQLIIS